MMGPDIDTFLCRLGSAAGLDDFQALIVDLRTELGIDHTVYHWVSSDGEQYGCGTYPAAWAQRYSDMDYLRIDPVIRGCFTQFHPVDWQRLDWSPRAVREFRKDAVEHGIGNQGYSVPVRGPNGQFAIFTVSHSCNDATWSAFTRDHQRDLILIAHFFNQRALELETARTPEPARTLSPREIDTLTYLAMGYSRGQIADMLAISEHTLRAYVEGARAKLGAANTIHAVCRALSEGLIVTGGAARAAPGNWPGRHPDMALRPARLDIINHRSPSV